MNIRMAEKDYAKQRRNRAVLLSLAAHVIAIILTAVFVLKPKVEQMMENSVSAQRMNRARLYDTPISVIAVSLEWSP